MKIAISEAQLVLLNALLIYTNRNDSHRGKRRKPAQLPSYAVLGRRIGKTARWVATKMHELKKKGIIEIGKKGQVVTVLVVGQAYLPSDHIPKETKPREIDRESRLACIAFVTGHRPWQVDLGNKY